MSVRRRPKGWTYSKNPPRVPLVIDVDALMDATAKAVREAHWGALPQYEDCDRG